MIADADDLEVSLDGTIVTSGFVIDGVGVQVGGNVTFDAASASGVKVLLALKPLLTREIDYQQFGDWMAPTVNLDFDKLWLAMQYLKQLIKSCVKLAYDTTDEPIIDEAPADRANKFIGFDVDGAFALITAPELSAVEDAAAAVLAAAAALIGFTNRGAWLTATAYVVNNLVQSGGATYICLVDHTSGTFATDLAGAKWALFAAKGAAGAGTGDMVGADNLSELTNTTTARTNLGLGTAATKDTGTTAGKVVVLDGSAKLPAVDGSLLTGLASGSVLSIEAVTAAGAYSKTAPAGTTKALVEIVGGGAYGAAAANGATGGYARKLVTISGGANLVGAVGAGGTSGSKNGVATTVTSPATVTANGGTGGVAGAGGTATGGDVNLPGFQGSPSSGGQFAWPVNHGYLGCYGGGGAGGSNGSAGIVVITWLK